MISAKSPMTEDSKSYPFELGFNPRQATPVAGTLPGHQLMSLLSGAKAMVVRGACPGEDQFGQGWDFLAAWDG
jgi:hypothetical protein